MLGCRPRSYNADTSSDLGSCLAQPQGRFVPGRASRPAALARLSSWVRPDWRPPPIADLLRRQVEGRQGRQNGRQRGRRDHLRPRGRGTRLLRSSADLAASPLSRQTRGRGCAGSCGAWRRESSRGGVCQPLGVHNPAVPACSCHRSRDCHLSSCDAAPQSCTHGCATSEPRKNEHMTAAMSIDGRHIANGGLGWEEQQQQAERRRRIV